MNNQVKNATDNKVKIEILYRSMTGHSKKIAKAISNALDVIPQSIKKNPVLDGVDIAFIVGGIYSGNSLPDTLEYIKTLMPTAVKQVALITSSTQDKTGQIKVREILESNQIKVIDEYRCRGNFLFLKMGHPNKKEIAGAVEFAKGCLPK